MFTFLVEQEEHREELIRSLKRQSQNVFDTHTHTHTCTHVHIFGGAGGAPRRAHTITQTAIAECMG
jgi:hypothetical protein